MVVEAGVEQVLRQPVDHPPYELGHASERVREQLGTGHVASSRHEPAITGYPSGERTYRWTA